MLESVAKYKVDFKGTRQPNYLWTAEVFEKIKHKKQLQLLARHVGFSSDSSASIDSSDKSPINFYQAKQQRDSKAVQRSQSRSPSCMQMQVLPS